MLTLEVISAIFALVREFNPRRLPLAPRASNRVPLREGAGRCTAFMSVRGPPALL